MYLHCMCCQTYRNLCQKHTHIEYSYCLIFCMCRLMNNSISFFVYYPRLLLYALSGTKVRLARTSAPQGSSVWMTAAAVNGGCDPPPGQSVTLQCIPSSSLPPFLPTTTTASTPAVCSLGPSASCLLRLRTVINRQSKLRPFFSSPSAVSHKHKPPMPPPGILEMSEELSQGFPAPVKLSQTCKTEPLMKYINLEHCACIHSIVLFAYKPPCGGGGREERREAEGWRYTWQACYWGKRVCSDLVAGKHWCIAVSSSRIEQMKRFVRHHWYDWQRRGRRREKKTELSQDHICLADTADVPTDRWVRMSYCVSGFFGKGFKNAFIQSHVFWDDLVSLTFCETQNGI